jgi:hypothetical protein
MLKGSFDLYHTIHQVYFDVRINSTQHCDVLYAVIDMLVVLAKQTTCQEPACHRRIRGAAASCAKQPLVCFDQAAVLAFTLLLAS